MHRTELPNNTDEQVREYVTKAIDLADEFAERECAEWRAIFRAAFDGYHGKQIMFAEPQAVDLSAILSNGGRR